MEYYVAIKIPGKPVDLERSQQCMFKEENKNANSHTL